jgi:hypothetical protein
MKDHPLIPATVVLPICNPSLFMITVVIQMPPGPVQQLDIALDRESAMAHVLPLHRLIPLEIESAILKSPSIIPACQPLPPRGNNR